MSLTPVEIRHVRIGRRPLGYERPAVDRLLDDIASSYEDVWRDRADLRDEIDRLEGELRRQREIEEALRNTLLSAERMADELRARAHQEADLIVEEARAKAREIGGRGRGGGAARPRRDPPSADARERLSGRVSGLPLLRARAAGRRLRGDLGEPEPASRQPV